MGQFEIKNVAETKVRISGGNASAFLLFKKWASSVTNEQMPKIGFALTDSGNSLKMTLNIVTDPGQRKISELKEALEKEIKGKFKLDYQLKITPNSKPLSGCQIELSVRGGRNEIRPKMSLNTLKKLKTAEV